MNESSGDITEEEIADIIFNSDDPELNDMLQRAKSYNYEMNHLIWKMTIDINIHFGRFLAENSDSSNYRKSFLFDKDKK